MSTFRPLKVTDLETIVKIHERFHKAGFTFPSQNNCINDGVVEIGDKIVAYGTVKLLAELILVLDLDETKRIKLDAFVKLLKVAIMDAREAKVEQLHCFVEDPNFASLLKKHFGFVPIPSEALVLNL